MFIRIARTVMKLGILKRKLAETKESPLPFNQAGWEAGWEAGWAGWEAGWEAG